MEIWDRKHGGTIVVNGKQVKHFRVVAFIIKNLDRLGECAKEHFVSCHDIKSGAH